MRAKLRQDVLPAPKKFRLEFSEFLGVNPSESEKNNTCYCSYCCNVAFQSGTLTNAQGITQPKVVLSDGTECALPTGITGCDIKKIVLFPRFDYTNNLRDDYLVALTVAGEIYVTPVANPTFYKLTPVIFTSADVSFVTYYFDGYDVILMCSPISGELYLYDVRHVRNMSNAPGMRSICIYADRVFGISATSAHTLCYSSELDPTAWTVGTGLAGSIALLSEGGAIKKLVPFNGYLLICREHCVQRMHIFNSPENYAVTEIFNSCECIVPDTITVAGDKVVFLAGKSLYTTDGFSVQEIYKGVTSLIENSLNSNAVYLGNKYRLATKIAKYSTENIGDEGSESNMKNNALLTFDFSNGEVAVMRGADIATMGAVATGRSSVILVCFNGNRKNTVGMLDASGAIYGTALKKLWVTEISDRDSLELMRVPRRIHVGTSGQVNIKVTIGGDSRNVTFSGESGVKSKKVMGIGKKLILELTATTATLQVYALALDGNLIGRYYGN